MIRIEREIIVECPAGEVFDRLVRIEDLPRWQPAIVDAAITSPEPVGVGSTIRLVLNAAGKRTEATGRVTEFEEGERLGLEATAGPATVNARVHITPVTESSSRVAVATEIALGGMLRFVEGIARSRIEGEAPAAALALKEWLESETPSAGT